MSHQPERKEKDCLNCGTLVAGRFCQKCGQENVVTKQTVGSLIKHFVYDIFHFDGKFFDTVKYLLIKPGQVPKQYISGKRISYLDPIRMYLFTSAIFFLVFFTIKNAVEVSGGQRLMTPAERLTYASSLNRVEKDSSHQKQFNYLMDTTYQLALSSPGPVTDSSFLIDIKGSKYLMQASKKVNDADTTTILGKRLIFDENNRDEKIKAMLESFVHKLPYLLFVSLPFFALILKLLYRRNKNFYYSDHGIFTLYHYIFSFLLLLVLALLSEGNNRLEWKVLRYLTLLLLAWGGIYLYWSMLKFYGQKWGKTLGKFLLLNILGFIMLLMLFIVFLIVSLLQQM